MVKHRGHNEGTITQRADGRWEARVSLPDGKRKSIYGKTRREVEKKLRDILNDLERGLLPPDGRQTVEQFLTYWLQSVAHDIEPSTLRIYGFHIRRFLKGFSGLPLSRLTPQQVQVFYARMISDGLAPTTVNRMHAVLKQAINDAMRLGIVPRNIFEVVRPPRYEPEPKQVLTEEQARQLLEAVRGDRLEALYVLVLATGLREGELFALQWQDINFDEGTLEVRQGLQRTPDGYRIRNPKTRTSKRTIALASHVVEALREHRQRQELEKRVLGEIWDNTYDLVFPNAFGRPKKPANFIRKQFPRVLAKAGLPDINFHDLRHTAATLLLRRGVHIKVVSEMLGHASVGITLGIYAHVLPNMQRDAADMAAKMFGRKKSE